MEPVIIEKSLMILLGFSFFGNPFKFSPGWTEENEIGRLWQRFIGYYTQHTTQIKHVKMAAVMLELHIEHAETTRTGEYELFVGVEVERLEDVPVEMTVKILPATTYAVFTLHSNEINADWSKRIAGWMSAAGYQSAYPYSIQWYDERFKGMQHLDESVLDVYIPVTRCQTSH